MNGKRYLLDTNAVVALLRGHSALVTLLQTADWVGISIISQIEFLAFPGLNQADRLAFDSFSARVEVVGLTADSSPLIDSIIALRQQHRLKLPDAIIAATAQTSHANLVTNDQQFQSTTAVPVVQF